MSHSISACPSNNEACGAGAVCVAACGVGCVDACAVVVVAAAVACGAALAAFACASNVSTTEPSATLSPSLTFNSFTTPAILQGISMLALSDSTVIKD